MVPFNYALNTSHKPCLFLTVIRALNVVENFKTFCPDTVFFLPEAELYVHHQKICCNYGQTFWTGLNVKTILHSDPSFATGPSVLVSVPKTWLHLCYYCLGFSRLEGALGMCKQRKLTPLKQSLTIWKLTLNVSSMPQSALESSPETKLKALICKDSLTWVCLLNFTVNGSKLSFSIL